MRRRTVLLVWTVATGCGVTANGAGAGPTPAPAPAVRENAPAAPVQERIVGATGPRLSGGADGARTGGGVQVASAWAGFGLTASRGSLALRATGHRAQIRQGPSIRQATGASLVADSLIVGDAGRVYGELGIWIEDAGPTSPRGVLAATMELDDGSTWSGGVMHGPVWTGPSGRDPLRGVRMEELAALDTRLTTTEFRVVGVKRWGMSGGLAVEAGGSRYNDGNQRAFAYTHARLPLVTSSVLRLAVQPNAYGETFSAATPGLLTPEGYAALGLAGGIGLTLGPWTLDVEGNPHWFHYPGTTGIGIEVTGSSSLRLGRIRLDLSGALLDQVLRTYAQARAGIGIPFG